MPYGFCLRIVRILTPWLPTILYHSPKPTWFKPHLQDLVGHITLIDYVYPTATSPGKFYLSIEIPDAIDSAGVYCLLRASSSDQKPMNFKDREWLLNSRCNPDSIHRHSKTKTLYFNFHDNEARFVELTPVQKSQQCTFTLDILFIGKDEADSFHLRQHEFEPQVCVIRSLHPSATQK